jgi:hypothetical protein
MSKIDIARYADLRSFYDSQRLLDSTTGANIPASGTSLTTIARGIISVVPSDVTFMDLGVREDNSGGWANFITSLRLGYNGEFVREGTSAKGEGTIHISGESNTLQVYGYQASSHFSITQQKQAQMEGWNVLQRLHEAHTVKYFEKIDELSYDRLVNGGYEKQDAPKTWDTMDDNEKLTYIYELLKGQRAGRKRTYWADTLVVDDRVYNDITTIDYSSMKEGTIAQKIQQTFNVKIVSSWRLYEAGTGGTRAMVAFNSNPYNIVNRIPVRLMFSPNSKKGFRTEFEAIFRVAGMDLLDLGGGVVGDKL